jgi:hypothetical protein
VAPPLKLGHKSWAFEPEYRRLFPGADDSVYLEYLPDQFNVRGGWVVQIDARGKPELRLRLSSKTRMMGAGEGGIIYTGVAGKPAENQPWYNVTYPIEIDCLRLFAK